MAIRDWFRRAEELPAPEDSLPDMHADRQTLADAMHAQHDFRGRETAQPHQPPLEEGLPSVNRRRGNNPVVTVLGFAFLLVAGAALIYSVNAPKRPHAKHEVKTDDRIANNLPHIELPAPQAPPPLTLNPVAPGQVTPGQGAPGQAPTAAPIPLRAAAGPQAGKPPVTWMDRKRDGSLLVGRQLGAALPQGTAQHPMTPEEFARLVQAGQGTPAAASGFMPGASPSQPPAPSTLALTLQPTMTKAAAAALLPNRNYLVTKGTALDCALETALDSSLPGLTTCRLTRDVYSDDGKVLLMDRGSQFVGEYQGGIKQGQVRVGVLWTRLKTPNGVVVSLDSPGTDALGRTGLEGWVDNHFLERFGAAILMSFINQSAAMAASSSGGQTTNIYGGSVSGGEKIVEKILDSTVNIPPTIIKNQGDHIQIMVARDLDFSTVYGLRLR